MKDFEDDDYSVVYNIEKVEENIIETDPEAISPGVSPFRMNGRRPKCFFALFKSFLGASLMGFSPEPEYVDLLLSSNPCFARFCGFVPKSKFDDYSQFHIPSLRKLEQFDQIMRESNLWEEIKIDMVRRNLEKGIIDREEELVGDTTHYYAYSNFETVEYQDNEGKKISIKGNETLPV